MSACDFGLTYGSLWCQTSQSPECLNVYLLQMQRSCDFFGELRLRAAKAFVPTFGEFSLLCRARDRFLAATVYRARCRTAPFNISPFQSLPFVLAIRCRALRSIGRSALTCLLSTIGIGSLPSCHKSFVPQEPFAERLSLLPTCPLLFSLFFFLSPLFFFFTSNSSSHGRALCTGRFPEIPS